jgi:hypothetical protein
MGGAGNRVNFQGFTTFGTGYAYVGEDRVCLHPVDTFLINPWRMQ